MAEKYTIEECRRLAANAGPLMARIVDQLAGQLLEAEGCAAIYRGECLPASRERADGYCEALKGGEAIECTQCGGHFSEAEIAAMEPDPWCLDCVEETAGSEHLGTNSYYCPAGDENDR